MRDFTWPVLLFLLSGCVDPDDSTANAEAVPFTSAFRTLDRVRLRPHDDNPLGQVARIERLSDGFAIADLMASDIKVFDDDGRLLRVIGGAGDGPGELRGPFVLAALPGDTLVVLDQRARLAVYGPDGTYVGGWQVPVRPVFGMVLARDGNSLLIAGTISIENGIPETAAAHDVHQFSRSGRYIRSMVDREQPMMLPEASFMGTPISEADGVLTVGRFSRNDLRHHDLSSRRTWRTTTGAGFYEAPDWSRAKGRTIEDAIRFAEPYAWLERVMPVGCGGQLVVFQRSERGRREYQYVVHHPGSGDVVATGRTPIDVGGTDGSAVFATAMDEAGNLDLLVLSLAEGRTSC